MPGSKKEDSIRDPPLSDQNPPSSQKHLEQSLKYSEAASLSAALSTSALVLIPLSQQLHEQFSKTSGTGTLSTAAPSVMSVSLPMDVHHVAESKQNNGLKVLLLLTPQL